MGQQPSANADSEAGTLLDDFNQFFLITEGSRSHSRADSAIAQIEKDGELYMVCYTDSNSFLLFELNALEPLELFGLPEEFLPPEDFLTPVLYEDQSFCNMVRCIQIDLGEGDRLSLWMMLDMTEKLQEHRRFIRRSILFMLGLTVLASIVSMLLMRRFVTRPILRLARAAKEFKPEEDGTYSREKVSRVDIKSKDEIGDLSRDIRTMQEGIIENTEHLALMTAEKERISTELNLARTIQTSMLPHIFPAFPNRPEFDIYALMQPAKKVGGDFYDYFLIDPDHLCMVMADVSGKGVPAALFMMVSKIILQSIAMLGFSTGDVIVRTNEAICSNNEAEMFVTVWLGVLELSIGKLTAANAGHEYPVVRQPDGPFELFRDKHGFVIGGMEGVKYKDYQIMLKPGARLFVYTDGVVEATNGEEELFGTERMLKALNEATDATPQALLEHLRTEVGRFVGDAPQFDDITMLCCEYKGPQDPRIAPQDPPIAPQDPPIALLASEPAGDD